MFKTMQTPELINQGIEENTQQNIGNKARENGRNNTNNKMMRSIQTKTSKTNKQDENIPRGNR
eukprot:121815-Amphidinium_carterae.1